MRNKWVLFGVVASLLVLTASVALAADGSVRALWANSCSLKKPFRQGIR